MNRYLICFALFSCLFSTTIHAAGIMDIQWNDLVPELPARENPLADLSAEELDFVEWIIYLRESLPEEITPRYQEFYDEMTQALPELKAKGIDVDRIIERRRQQNGAVNNELDGRSVRLAGYLLPLDLSGKAVSDFLLVPYVGACIHTPPPPPNQIVHAVSATPMPYDVKTLFRPVQVTGKMRVQSLSKELFLVDGSSDIDIGYSMSVSAIDEYKPAE